MFCRTDGYFFEGWYIFLLIEINEANMLVLETKNIDLTQTCKIHVSVGYTIIHCSLICIKMFLNIFKYLCYCSNNICSPLQLSFNSSQYFVRKEKLQNILHY